MSETASGPGSPRGQPAWRGGCDRIIFHLSFFIYHRQFEGLICHRAMSDNEQMRNDPVTTAVLTPDSDK